MKMYIAHQYTVTDDEIKPSGKVEYYSAPDRDSAVSACLYYHRLHNGRAFASKRGVIHCPDCGQLAVVKSHEQD